MKITLVRLSVLALALTGFSAATVVSHSQTKASAKVACIPAPMCGPNSGGVGCW